MSACSFSWQSMASLAAEISVPEFGKTVIDVEPGSKLLLYIEVVQVVEIYQ